jgi:ubiquinone/menaquinone biosynthesis C-methylase UbiE
VNSEQVRRGRKDSMMKETYWQKIPFIVGPAVATDFDKIGQKNTRDAFEAWILEHSDSSTRLLDAGCNTGVEAFRLFGKNFPGVYTGVDSNLKALALAMRNSHGHPASFLEADLESVPYPDGYFDIVLNKDVIEHAVTYEPILKELARLTRRWLVLSMFIRMQEGPDQINPHPDGYHLNRYQRKRLLDHMKSCGFSTSAVLHEEDEDEVILFEK